MFHLLKNWLVTSRQRPLKFSLSPSARKPKFPFGMLIFRIEQIFSHFVQVMQNFVQLIVFCGQDISSLKYRWTNCLSISKVAADVLTNGLRMTDKICSSQVQIYMLITSHFETSVCHMGLHLLRNSAPYFSRKKVGKLKFICTYMRITVKWILKECVRVRIVCLIRNIVLWWAVVSKAIRIAVAKYGEFID